MYKDWSYFYISGLASRAVLAKTLRKTNIFLTQQSTKSRWKRFKIDACHLNHQDPTWSAFLCSGQQWQSEASDWSLRLNTCLSLAETDPCYCQVTCGQKCVQLKWICHKIVRIYLHWCNFRGFSSFNLITMGLGHICDTCQTCIMLKFCLKTLKLARLLTTC